LTTIRAWVITLPFDAHVRLVSGRASFEILQKALAAGSGATKPARPRSRRSGAPRSSTSKQPTRAAGNTPARPGPASGNAVVGTSRPAVPHPGTARSTLGRARLETPTQHMHVMALAILDESALPAGTIFGRIRHMFASRLASLPRFRQRIRMVPFGLAPPSGRTTRTSI